MGVIGVLVLMTLLGSADLGDAQPDGYATMGVAASEAVPGVQSIRGLCLLALEAAGACTACARAGCPGCCSGATAAEPKPSRTGDAALARAATTAGTCRDIVDRATGPRLADDPGLPGDCTCAQTHDAEANGERN